MVVSGVRARLREARFYRDQNCAELRDHPELCIVKW